MLKIFIILVWCQLGLLSGINADCVVPNPPSKSTYSIVGSLEDPVPGSTMKEFQVLRYDCPKPYILQGGIITICENGIWEPEIPTCMRGNACVVPDAPTEGSYFFPDSQDVPVAGLTVQEFQILNYDCPAPNILQGIPVIYCRNGNWLPDIPRCFGNTPCTLPAVPVNAGINAVQDVNPSLPGIQVPSLSSVEYSCDAMFELIGTGNISCYDGSWSSEPPQCQKITSCVIPDAPAKGSYSILGSQDAPVAGSMVEEFKVLKYDCPTPNIFQGPPVIYCENGNWLPEVPSCRTSKPCTLPAVPMNAGINAVQDVNPSLPGIQVPSLSNVKYFCDATFELIGTANISCYDESWSSEPPQCQKTTACVVPGAPTKGSYSILGSQDAPVAGSTVKEFQVLKYDCPAPNIFQGLPLIYCENGNWLPVVPRCRTTKPCTLPAVPVNARINAVQDVDDSLPGIQIPSLSNIKYSCDATFELIGTANISCNDGLWSSEPPQCQRSTNCILPDLPVRGTYSIIGSEEAPVPGAAIAEKEVLRYNCVTKYRGPTDQVIVCSGGKWLPGVVECLDLPSDCGDVLGDTSGVYVIQPTSNTEPFDVYCDLTLAGQKLTVIQQRFNGDVDFYRNYTEYSAGFGPKMGNHWLGLEHIHEITKGGHHELYVDLEAHNGTKAYARYETFIVGNSSTGFQLTISGYSGTAGDSMYKHSLNGMKFSTYDKDQDDYPSVNCAEEYKGAWWYWACSWSNLNSPYHDTAVYGYKTMHWDYNFDWYALKTSRMLIRRK